MIWLVDRTLNLFFPSRPARDSVLESPLAFNLVHLPGKPAGVQSGAVQLGGEFKSKAEQDFGAGSIWKATGGVNVARRRAAEACC